MVVFTAASMGVSMVVLSHRLRTQWNIADHLKIWHIPTVKLTLPRRQHLHNRSKIQHTPRTSILAPTRPNMQHHRFSRHRLLCPIQLNVTSMVFMIINIRQTLILDRCPHLRILHIPRVSLKRRPISSHRPPSILTALANTNPSQTIAALRSHPVSQAILVNQ